MRVKPIRDDAPDGDFGDLARGLRLTHADTEKDFAVRNPRQKGQALVLGAVAQQQRRALPVGDPMRSDGGAGRQQLLGHE